MGSFYVNFTLNHPADGVAAVAETLRKAKRDAYLAGDSKTESIVVFERETDEQDPSAITRLGKLLSTKHGCPVLAVANEDDDVLRYWLFDRGKVIDTFDSTFERVSEQNFVSAAGFRVNIMKFDPARQIGSDPTELDRRKPHRRGKDERGGDVQKLCAAFGVPKATDKVMNVLLGEYVFVSDQHRALCKAIGLSCSAVGGGYQYLLASQLPKGLPKSRLIRVHSPTRARRSRTSSK